MSTLPAEPTTTAAAIIVAAGSSRRMVGRDKLWSLLAGRATLARTIDVFEASPIIEHIVLVINSERIEAAARLREREAWRKVADIVAGGARRQDSVRNGLDALAELAPQMQWVMIHDGARPLVTGRIIEAGLQAAQQSGAAIAAVPVKDTIKHVENGLVQATIDRSRHWAAQTPQVFSFALIRAAYSSPHSREEATDDAALLERLGKPVTVFPGSYTNIKITTPEDIRIAEALLQGAPDL